MAITRDEWLKALDEANGPTDPDAVTVSELAGMLGVSTRTAQDRLRRMVSDGRAVRTFKTVTRSNGHVQRVGAYRLVKRGKKAVA